MVAKIIRWKADEQLCNSSIKLTTLETTNQSYKKRENQPLCASWWQYILVLVRYSCQKESELDVSKPLYLTISL